jgi:response regulator RpfG family c-di-GMP phosphodiesterase
VYKSHSMLEGHTAMMIMMGYAKIVKNNNSASRIRGVMKHRARESRRTSTLLIIDEHKQFRDSLDRYIKKNIKNILVIKAKTAEEGLKIARDKKPNFVLIDLELRSMNSVIASETIKKELPECVIIVLTVFAGDVRKKNHITPAIDEVIGKNEIEIKLLPLLKKRSPVAAG